MEHKLTVEFQMDTFEGHPIDQMETIELSSIKEARDYVRDLRMDCESGMAFCIYRICLYSEVNGVSKLIEKWNI